jgi:uncharacterized membrane protein YdbT with pleckstrin-like domain
MVNHEHTRRRSSRRLYVKYYFFLILVFIASLYTWASEMNFSPLTLWASIISFIVVLKLTELHRLSNHYEVKDSMITHTQGLFGRDSKVVGLKAISDILVKQTVWQRIWMYGDVHLSIFGNYTYVKNIDKPYEYAAYIQEIVTASKEEFGD